MASVPRNPCHIVSKFFPSIAKSGTPRSSKQLIYRALLFAAGLALLWIILQMMPVSPPLEAPSSLPDSGTETTQLSSGSHVRGDVSLFTPGYLAVIILLCAGVVIAFILRKRSGLQSEDISWLQTLGKMRLDQNQQLRLVACGGDVLLLGISNEQISLLKQYPSDTFSGQPEAPPANPPTLATPFSSILGRFSGQPIRPQETRVSG